jgi:hypothetical protein
VAVPTPFLVVPFPAKLELLEKEQLEKENSTSYDLFSHHGKGTEQEVKS